MAAAYLCDYNNTAFYVAFVFATTNKLHFVPQNSFLSLATSAEMEATMLLKFGAVLFYHQSEYLFTLQFDAGAEAGVEVDFFVSEKMHLYRQLFIFFCTI